MEYVQVIGSLSTIGILWFLIRDVKKEVMIIKDNHLKHIADDISDIKERVSVLETTVKIHHDK